MNYMEQVAQMLGVKLEDKFKVKDFKETFKIAKNGMYMYSLFSDGYTSANHILLGLLIGIYEIEKPILDDIEKEYLSGVIKPFRNKVVDIIKRGISIHEYIVIYYRDDIDIGMQYMCFPFFNKGTMYKGMEVGKKYTLEELGL